MGRLVGFHRFAPAVVAGLMLGWAAAALADVPAANVSAPPSAPIFYCPTPSSPSRGMAPPARAGRRTGHHSRLCPGAEAHRQAPGARKSASREPSRHERGGKIALSAPQRPSSPAPRAGQDVSAAQAFIYRYERALGGLDPRAANEA